MLTSPERSCVVFLLMSLAACAPPRQTYVPPAPPQPEPAVYLPVDSGFVQLTPAVDVRRMGSWNGSLNLRHFWARYWKKDTNGVLEEVVDCGTRTTELMSFVEYDNKGDGTPKSSWSAPTRQFVPLAAKGIAPGSVRELAVEWVCQPPVTQ